MSSASGRDREWCQRLIRETRALQGLSPRIEDDPVSVELAARFLAEGLRRRDREHTP